MSHGWPGMQVKYRAEADGGFGLHRQRGLSTNGQDECDFGHQKWQPNYAHKQHSAKQSSKQANSWHTWSTGNDRRCSYSRSNSGGEKTSCFNWPGSKSGGGGGSAGGATFRRCNSASTSPVKSGGSPVKSRPGLNRSNSSDPSAFSQ